MIPTSELNFENAIDYHYNQFPPKDIDYSRLIKPLVKATNAIARFDQMLKNMHNSEFMIAPLRNQEAILSSRMEGTVSTIDEILQYEADYIDGTNDHNIRNEVIETVLYQRSLKFAQESIENGDDISQWLIRSLHQMLLSFGRGASKSPGEYKSEQNYLVDKTKRNVLFIPINHTKLHDGLDNLFDYIETSDEEIMIKTAIAHLEFEALHPFKDGNGRIGRMIITLMLWKLGVISSPHFYISGYFEEHKDEYIDLMRQVSQNGDWVKWCEFFIKAIEHQSLENLRIAESIKKLYEDTKITFNNKLSSRHYMQALDFIFTNPIFRNNNFISKSGIPTSTAYNFIKTLLKENLIVTIEPAAGQRSAMYGFEPLLSLVRV